MKFPTVRGLGWVSGVLALAFATAAHAATQSPFTLVAGSDHSRATIPIAIDGTTTRCVLDTGTSAMLVSPALASAANLASGQAVSEIAPDGSRYRDRATHLAVLSVGNQRLYNLPALISAKLSGTQALCGYDFFARVPIAIDRDHQRVTLFPPATAYAGLRCMLVDLSARVPIGDAFVNGTLLHHIVYDSGMIGGGALWRGVLPQLAHPLALPPSGAAPSAAGLRCGANATAGFARDEPVVGIALCVASQRPDGQNGILETDLPTVHRLAIDYPHHRICFGLGAPTGITSIPPTDTLDQTAWTRLNAQHPTAPSPTP